MAKVFRRAMSLLLVFVMMTSLVIPAFAADTTQWISQSRSDIPVIRISGDGEKLVDENGEKVFHYKDFASILDGGDEEEDGEDSDLLESVVNILQPFLIDGLLNDNWEPYYENLQAEISDIFENSLLDKDGNPQYGTGLRQERIDKMNTTRYNDQAWYTSDGVKYYVQDRYWFYYDWRLDPIESAAQFKAFVDDIIASSNCPQVGVIASCLGTNVVTAYLALYPQHAAQYIRGVAFDGSVVGGAEMLSEAISGKFNVDAAAINRTLKDCAAIGMFDIDEFINLTIEMLDRTGVFDTAIGVTKKLIYYKLVEGVTSALALSTFYTWPNYWACVSTEDYETAKSYVFGPKGSEKRTEYAGLIAKLDNYHNVVRTRIPEILSTTVENGVHFGVISKYGFQTLPICETNYLVSDQFASVGRSSFGATTGTIYNDLSDEYIASKIENNLGKYISPDGQIDASTCLFRDSTWFIKGSSHSNWSDWELRLLYDIATSKEQVTIENSCWPSQFVVYKYTNPDEETQGSIEIMTAENCDTENWEADDKLDNPTNIFSKLYVAFITWVKWFKAVFIKIFG